jgi:hypothetical protein
MVRTVPTKRVQFQEGEPKAWVDCLHFTEEDKRAYWFRSSDFAEIERNRRAMERALRRSRGDVAKLDPSQWCYRGMEEMLSTEYASRLLHQRSNLMKEVLDEQARQLVQGYHDDSRIQEVSSSHSEWARVFAIELAEHDSRVAATGEDVPIPVDVKINIGRIKSNMNPHEEAATGKSSRILYHTSKLTPSTRSGECLLSHWKIAICADASTIGKM